LDLIAEKNYRTYKCATQQKLYWNSFARYIISPIIKKL
jgi:hypothetical protein